MIIITEDMATFTALVKIYSTKYFCNTKVAGVDEILVQQKFSAIWYVLAKPHDLRKALKSFPITL